MDPEDLLPRTQPPQKKNLEIMGVSELEDYIADLEAEIARARAVIESKQSHRSGAEALFKR